MTPHVVNPSAAAAAALAARDQLLVAGATPESSLLALLVRDFGIGLPNEAGERDAYFE